MKRIIYCLIFTMTLVSTSCDKKENVNNSPDLSGKYSCSFSVPASPIYSLSETLIIQKSGDSGFTITGNTPFTNATLWSITGNQYQFRIPQTDIIKNGKTYYLTLVATLIYEKQSFTTSSCQAAYGEKGVSGNTYTISNFKLRRLQ